MKKVYFRADANAAIGYGHFIRTLALANMLKEYFDCIFYTVSPTEYQIKEMEKVCKYVCLSEKGCFETFLNSLCGDEIVVLDNYFYTSEYQLSIKKKGAKLVVIDDLHNQHNYADIVINHGLTDENLFDCEPYTKLCLGLQWALLRSPFLKYYPLKRDDSILVNFGGADPYNLTSKIVSMLLNSNYVGKIKIILGDKARFFNVNSPRVEIYQRLSAEEMSFHMRSSKCAILCASTVCLEALYSEMPICVGYYVDNQKEFYNTLRTNTGVVSVGNLLEITENILMNSLDKIDLISPVPLDGSLIKSRYIKLISEI